MKNNMFYIYHKTTLNTISSQKNKIIFENKILFCIGGNYSSSIKIRIEPNNYKYIL